MSKSIRVTVTRPDLGTEMPWDSFTADTMSTAATWKTTFPGNPSYLSLGFAESLTVEVDHVITNDADLEANRSAMMALIPWWKTAENAAAVDALLAASNITFTIAETTAPVDLSGHTDITDLS